MIGKKVICLGTIAMTFMLNVYGKGVLRCDDKDVQDKLIHLIMKKHLDTLDDKKAKQIVKNSLKITYGDSFTLRYGDKDDGVDYVKCIAKISKDIKYEKILEIVNLELLKYKKAMSSGEYNEMLDEEAQEVHSKLQKTTNCMYEAERTDDGIHISDLLFC